MTLSAILQIKFADILQNFTDFWWSLPIAILSCLLFYFFTHPDKIAIWSSLIASAFEKLSARSARHSVSTDIQGRVSSYIKNNHADGILPYGLKFKWLREDNFSSYVEDDDVIVIMDYHNNNARNFVNAIRQYTSKAFLPTIRHELPPEILTAAELTLQEKIIREKRPDALDIFRNEVLPEQVANNAEVEPIRDNLKQLDILGYFDNMFLTEVAFAGQRLQGLDLNQKIEEIKNFLKFLINIGDESMPLDYHGDIFCVQVILVARSTTKHRYGTTAYVKRAQTASLEKTNSLYVAGWGRNISFVNEVVDAIREEKIGRLEWTRNYKTHDSGKRKKSAKMSLFRL